MLRHQMIHQPGFVFHVLSRAYHGQRVFLDATDYQYYLNILKRFKFQFGFRVFAYCLMPDHLHMLLQISHVDGIDPIMQNITVAYARYFSRRYQTCEPVRQRDFKSTLIRQSNHLLAVMRFIEQNPWRAGISRGISDYPWTSFSENIKKRMTGIVDGEENFVFRSLGVDFENRMRTYRRLVATFLGEEEIKEIRNRIRGPGLYGSPQSELVEKVFN